MGLDFDLEEGNIKGVKEGRPGRGPSGKIFIAAIVIVVLAAFLLWFMSNRNVLYSTLPAFGSSFGPITTAGSDSNAVSAEGMGASQPSGNEAQEASRASAASQETPREPLSIAFSAQLVSSDYSLRVSSTDIEIEGRVSGTTQSESFALLAGNYTLKNFSGRIWANKGFVKLEGTSDEFGTPIGARKVRGTISLTAESGALAMKSVYLNAFSQTVTGNVNTSTTTASASGNFSLSGFQGKIVLGLNNSVAFDGKTAKLVVETTSGTVNMS